MNSRKLLAFILVFSLATQPCGVRFGYAEDAKAAEVENKAEASDEIGIDLDEAELDEYLFNPGSREQKLEETATVAAEETAKTSKISGALAGAIAASVAAVTAAVATAGLIVYNGVSNKDAIVKVWTSDEVSFFSRLGKTVSILFKGAKKVVEETKKEPTGIDSYDNYLAGEGALSVEGTTRADHAEVYKEKQRIAKEEAERKAQELNSKKVELGGEVTSVQSRIDALKEEHKGTLQDELDTVKATIENATSVEELKGVEGQLTTLEGEVAEAEAAQKKAEDEARKLEELNGKKTKLNGEVTSVQSRIDALKEEHKGTLQDELDTVKATIENATSVEELEGVEGQLTTLEVKVAEAEAAQQKAEDDARKLKELNDKKSALNETVNTLQGRVDALKEEHKGSLQDELNAVKNTIENATTVEALEGVEGQLTTLEVKVAAAEAVQHDTNEGSNSREENPTTIFVEEKKESFVGPLPKKVYELIEKKDSALNTLNNLEATCGLDTVGFKRELSAIDLWTLTTPEELAQAEIKLNSITNRINDLRGKCSDIKSKKGYIEKNWPAAYKVLDKSDFNLNMAWNTLKNKPVTEGDLEKLSEEYKNIAGRVKAVINSNNKISKLTSKISKAIEDKKDAAWIDKDYYNEQLDNLRKKTKTEESLKEIVNELEELAKVSEVNEWLDKIERGELAQGICEYTWKLPFGKTLSYAGCTVLHGKVDEEVKHLKAKFKEDHDVDAFIKALKELYNNSQSYINDATYLEFDANEAEEIIKEAGKLGVIDVDYFNKELKENKDYSLDNLQTKRTAMKAFLNELQKNYSKKDIKAVNQKINSLKNSDLLKGELGDDYADLCSSVESSMGQVIAEAKNNHSLNGVVEKLEKLQANERSVVQKIRSLNRNTKAANDAIKQYENEAWFDKAYFEEWLQGATNDKIATEADLDLRANNVAAILNDLETNFSKKEIKAVNKALDEIDNSAIVKGTCTQSRWGGLKKENKLTSEQCNTLKVKFVAERDRLVEEAKSNRSLVGLATKLNDLYSKQDEYINDVAKLNADASEIEEIINEAGKFGLIDAEYFRKELAEKKTYLLENLKNQRTAMEAFLNDLKTNFGMENLNTLNSLDSEINKIISAFDEYEASYVSQYKEKYAAKREELKGMYDAGKAVAELEKYKKELQINLDKLKKSCENRPELCGKQ